MDRESKGKAYLEILARNAEHSNETPTASLGFVREFFLMRRLGATRVEAVSQFMLTL